MAAIAGRVMPITKGQYNSETTYYPLDFVTYNNALWGCIKETIGNAPTEGTYWKKAIDGNVSDAASLGGETAEAWQTKLDNIQTTSSVTLSQKGWYRVAEYVTTSTAVLQGANANSCTLIVKHGYSSIETDFYKISLGMGYKKPKFKLLDSVNGAHAITKVRYTYDSKGAYLEVYYAYNKSETVFCEITHGKTLNGAWQAITPILTSETVDGVTVTTTYDIPANASPVNSEDLAEAMEAWTFTANNYTSDEKFLEALNALHANYANDTRYETVINKGYSGGVLEMGGRYTVNGYRNDANYGYQILTRLTSGTDNLPKMLIYIRSLYGGVWTDFDTLTTKVELTAVANQTNRKAELLNTSILEKAVSLPTTSYGVYEYALGGTDYTGDDLPVSTHCYGNATVYVRYGFKAVVLWGANGVLPAINYYSTSAGTWSGWETLFTNKGGEVKANKVTPFVLHNISETDSQIMMGFKLNNTILGYLGFNGADNFVVYSSTLGTKKILHNGNYKDYALPLDGSVPMSGDIYLKNGYGLLVTGEKQIQLETRKAINDLTNRRMLLLYNQNALKEALRVSDIVNGVQTTYDVHHDGNSAKVVQATSAPSDTTAVWLDTTNKKVKVYIDGAWTALA